LVVSYLAGQKQTIQFATKIKNRISQVPVELVLETIFLMASPLLFCPQNHYTGHLNARFERANVQDSVNQWKERTKKQTKC